MNTTKIIEELRTGKEEKAFVRLYKFYPRIERYICMNSGSKDEAQDIFQEALVVFFNKVETIKANSAISIEGFLFNTCKLLWSNEIRKKKVRQNSSDKGLENLEYRDEIEDQLEKEAKINAIAEIFQKLEEKCKTLLELFYYKNFSMEKIAKRFGYKAVQSAKAKKYKCMEHARKLAAQMEESEYNEPKNV
jgi:RNA polymerase sigma factor (sigma-70 family)